MRAPSLRIRTRWEGDVTGRMLDRRSSDRKRCFAVAAAAALLSTGVLGCRRSLGFADDDALRRFAHGGFHDDDNQATLMARASDSALGVFLRRKKAQLGAPKAITATAHKLARLIYSMLRYGQDYVDLGAEYYENQYQQRALRAARCRAAQLGYRLVPMSDAPEHSTHVPPAAPIAA